VVPLHVVPGKTTDDGVELLVWALSICLRNHPFSITFAEG
jgi:hypothetical protein